MLHVAGAASPVEAPHLLGTRVLSPKWCYQPIFIAVYLQFFQRARIRKQGCSKSLGSVWTWRQQLVSLAALPAWGQILGHWTTPLADDGDDDDDDDGDDDGDDGGDGDGDDGDGGDGGDDWPCFWSIYDTASVWTEILTNGKCLPRYFIAQVRKKSFCAWGQTWGRAWQDH